MDLDWRPDWLRRIGHLDVDDLDRAIEDLTTSLDPLSDTSSIHLRLPDPLFPPT